MYEVGDLVHRESFMMNSDLVCKFSPLCSWKVSRLEQRLDPIRKVWIFVPVKIKKFNILVQYTTKGSRCDYSTRKNLDTFLEFSLLTFTFGSQRDGRGLICLGELTTGQTSLKVVWTNDRREGWGSWRLVNVGCHTYDTSCEDEGRRAKEGFTTFLSCFYSNGSSPYFSCI